MVLVMQTTHAQRWQYPDHVDKRLYFSIENVHRYITKIIGPYSEVRFKFKPRFKRGFTVV